MITINLFTSGRHTQPLIKALQKAKDIKLVNIYSKLPDLSAEALAKADFSDTPDVFIVADFGKIIPKKVLEMPKYGSLCIHPSLLPKYRGASPVQFAILNSEKETGVTIIEMDEKVDHGPIISQFKEKIRDDDTAESLYARLFSIGAQALIKILSAWVEGQIELRKQDHKKATYTKILTRDDGFISSKDLKIAMDGKSSAKAVEIERKIRAFQPWPGAWTKIKLKAQSSTHSTGSGLMLSKVEASKLKAKRLRLLQAHLEKILHTTYYIPHTKLILDEVQLEGKKPVSWKQFLEGYPEAKLI